MQPRLPISAPGRSNLIITKYYDFYAHGRRRQVWLELKHASFGKCSCDAAQFVCGLLVERSRLRTESHILPQRGSDCIVYLAWWNLQHTLSELIGEEI